MIRYALRCADGHAHDSWFQSAGAFDALVARGLVTCATCGSAEMRKALMAPEVSTPAKPDPAAARIARLRAKVEATSTYVGPRFAAEARAIHAAESDRSVYGEASGAEVRALLEDGIAVAPLPFTPKAKAN